MYFHGLRFSYGFYLQSERIEGLVVLEHSCLIFGCILRQFSILSSAFYITIFLVYVYRPANGVLIFPMFGIIANNWKLLRRRHFAVCFRFYAQIPQFFFLIRVALFVGGNRNWVRIQLRQQKISCVVDQTPRICYDNS